MKILAIETSCDETAAAIVEDGVHLISSSLATSSELHKKTGGIVPEVAARRQAESIVPVINDTLVDAGLSIDGAKKEIDILAVTVGPGLIGSLLVGVEAAKALALAWNKPLILVNHLVGHIYGNFIESPSKNSSDASDLPVDHTAFALGYSAKNIEFPALVLIVSGGHTDLVLMRGHGDLEFLGGTVDDAAGEAFDKTARLLGIATYLGGAKLSKLAAGCTNNVFAGRLPRPKINDADLDFSFSGLKTAVKRLVEKEFGSGFKDMLNNGTLSFGFDTAKDNDVSQDLRQKIAALSCEFETAVVDVLVKKTVIAAKKHNVKSILLGGGVSANIQLRSRMALKAKNLGISFHVPPTKLCTDNAIYIASAAYFMYASKRYSSNRTDTVSATYLQTKDSLLDLGNLKQKNLKKGDNKAKIQPFAHIQDIQANPSLSVTDLL